MRSETNDQETTILTAMASAGLAGMIATWPMTVFMNWADDEPVESPWSSLPPREITEELTSTVWPLSECQTKVATLVAHYGYGASVGALLPLLLRNCLNTPISSGVVFGLGVWAGSYYGLLPAIGSDASAPSQPRRVNASMVAAHVVWGAALGILTAAFVRATRAKSRGQNGEEREDHAEKSAGRSPRHDPKVQRHPDKAYRGAHTS